jgi:hypothetical protein
MGAEGSSYTCGGAFTHMQLSSVVHVLQYIAQLKTQLKTSRLSHVK